MKIALNTKLIGGFLIVAFITGFVGIMGYIGINSSTADTKRLGEVAIPTIINLEVIKIRMLEIKSAIRSLTSPYVKKEDIQRLFQNIENSRTAYNTAIEGYEKLHATAEQQKLYEILKEKMLVSKNQNNALIDQARILLTDTEIDRVALSKVLTDNAMSGDVRVSFDNMIAALDEILAYARKHYAEELITQSNQHAMINTILIMASSIIGFVLALFIGFTTAMSISKPINRISGELYNSSGNLESAAGQVSASSQELSSGASELASSVEEMTSSLEELQSIIESNSKNINEGELMMKETMTGSQLAVTQMDELKAAHEEIKDNSKKIEKIIKVIDDIAFQTNILALNAAVEAARAGEAGRGFAVVADQVKNLAQKSAEAAKETSALIETSINGVTKGYQLGENVGESLNKAVDLASKVATILDEVNKASKEQLKGAVQVTKAISQINTVVQQTASSSEETAAAGEELLSQAEVTKGIVGRLNELVKGQGAGLTMTANTMQRAPIDTRKTSNIAHIKQIEQFKNESHQPMKMYHTTSENETAHASEIFDDPEKQIPFDEF